MSDFDDRGRPLTGLLEIEPGEADVVRRILEWFAGGLSAIQIAPDIEVVALMALAANANTPGAGGLRGC